MRGEIHFLLNGTPRTVADAPPDTTLLRWLRAEGLTATKEGCNEGDCGACTVALGTPDDDGLRWQAVCGCLLLLPQVDGRAVVTAEGLGGRHPAQTLLADGHGTQCGYCTPGFVMSLYALSRSTAARDDATVLDALSGNLCRCTGYRPILEAARALPATGPVPGETAQGATLRARTAAALAYRAGDQTCAAPRTLDEALAWRARHPEAWVLAGGTDLGLRITKARQRPPALLSLHEVAELRCVAEDDSALVLGAALTYADALPHLARRHPAFAELVRRIGGAQIRNKGTIGGNLVNASPIGDTAPALIALDAEVELASVSGRRRVAVADFFTGYRQTVLAPDELVTAVRIPHGPPGQLFRAYKLAKRVDQDISTVAAGFALTLEDGRVARFRAGFGGVAATPVRARRLEQALTGQPWTLDAVGRAAEALQADIGPISDFRGSAGFRRTVAANLLRRFYLESQGEAVRLEALA